MHKSNGFSLIDLMVALFVTTLGTLAIFSLIITSASANKYADDYQIASNVARQQIEVLRSGQSHILENRTDAPLIGEYPQLNNLSQADAKLTIENYSGLAGVKQVRINIFWQTRTRSAERNLSMSTLIAERGIGY